MSISISISPKSSDDGIILPRELNVAEMAYDRRDK